MFRISVIITTYNRVGLLEKAIESVRTAGNDIEIIVVDDASTDGTMDYCNTLPGIKYIRLERNQKTAGARNAGLVASTAPYIAFLDDDDRRLRDSLAEQMAILETDKTCGLVHGNVLFCNQQGELTGESSEKDASPEGDILLALLENNFITLSSVLMRRTCLYTTGLFDTSPSMVGIEDWDLWLRIAEFYSIRVITKPVAVYRQPENFSGQWSSDITKQFSLAAAAYKHKWFKLPEVEKKLGNEFIATQKRILNNTSNVILYDALKNSKNFNEKRKKLLQAIKCYPGKLRQTGFYKTAVRIFFLTNSSAKHQKW